MLLWQPKQKKKKVDKKVDKKSSKESKPSKSKSGNSGDETMIEVLSKCISAFCIVFADKPSFVV